LLVLGALREAVALSVFGAAESGQREQEGSDWRWAAVDLPGVLRASLEVVGDGDVLRRVEKE
jgi:hypothetical protein